MSLGLADDLDAGLDGQQHRQSASEELLVIDDEDPDGLGVCLVLVIGHTRIMARPGGMWRPIL